MCAPGLLVNVEIKNLAERARLGSSGSRPPSCWWSSSPAASGRDRVLVSSFNLASIDRVRSLAPDVPTALLTWGQDPLEALLSAESHGHRALHPDLPIGRRSRTPAPRRRARTSGASR